MIALEGPCPGDAEAEGLRDASWRLYLLDAPEAMYDAETDPEPLDDDGEAEAVSALFRGRAAERIATLGRMRAELPDPTEARLRRAEAWAFEPRPGDAPLLRYEAQLSRQFHRTPADMVKLTETGADIVEAEAEAVAPTGANPAEVVDETGVDVDIPAEPGPDEPAPVVVGRLMLIPAVPSGDLGARIRPVAGVDPTPECS